jgi:hypothetical protein
MEERIMSKGWIVGAVLIAAAALPTAAMAADGIIMQPPTGHDSGKPGAKTLKTAPPIVINLPNPNAGQDALDAWTHAFTTLAPFVDASNLRKAQEAAGAAAVKAVRDSGKDYAIAAVTAREPVNPPEGDPVLSGGYKVRVRNYDAREPQAGNDINELRSALYGRRLPGINPAPIGGYMAGAMIAERRPDGGIVARPWNQDDHFAQLEEDKRRAIAAEQAQRARIEEAQKLVQAQSAKAAQDAALAEEERKKEQARLAARQAELDRQKKESEAREAALRQARQERDELIAEQKKACNSGDAAACTKATSKVNEWLETAEKRVVTSRCMIDADKGPCAPGASGCMYCAVRNEMTMSERVARFNALQVSTRMDLLKAGAKPGPGLEKRVSDRLGSPAMLKQHHHYDFMQKK